MTNYRNEEYYRNPAYKVANDAYTLCLAGVFFSFLTIIAAFVVALWNRKKVGEGIYRSHLEYVIYGSVYYTVFVGVCVAAIFWTHQQQFLAHGRLFTPLFLYLGFGLAPFVWWIWRFVRGVKLLMRNIAVANPQTFWLARS